MRRAGIIWAWMGALLLGVAACAEGHPVTGGSITSAITGSGFGPSSDMDASETAGTGGAGGAGPAGSPSPASMPGPMMPTQTTSSFEGCEVIEDCAPAAGCLGVENDGALYFFCGSTASYDDARATCETQPDTHLVHIGGDAENSWVTSMLSVDTWIGGRRDGEQFRWTDGKPFWRGDESGMAVDGAYSDWVEGHPNDAGDCALFFSARSAWAVASCSSSFGFVCERNRDTCPDDPMKSEPGQCGCGVPDVDSDMDGTLDCLDECPRDPLRTELGTCGCVGEPDPAPQGTPCDDGTCPGSQQCDGLGSCGAAVDCTPPADDCGELLLYEDHGYWVCTNHREWNEARMLCEAAGMQLVRIDSAEENDWVRAQIRGQTWIGGRHAGESSWVWAAGGDEFWLGRSGGSGTLYSNWANGEPDANNNDGACAFMDDNANGNWADAGCGGNTDAMCETLD